MSKHRFSAADTGLPAERVNEIHDCLALALNATEGQRIARASLNEARAYMRAALRTTSSLIGEVAQ